MFPETSGSDYTTATIDLSGGACALAGAGAGGRPLLLVHGFSGAKEDFTPWLGRLSDAGWHAVAYDNFGHGASAAPVGVDDYSLIGYRDQLFEVMAHLGWESCVVLGHSMGGMIAEEALALSPERFGAVILMDTSHGPMAMPEGYAAFVEAMIASGGVKGLLEAGNAIGAFEGAPSSRAVYARDPGYREFNEHKFLATAAPVFLTMMRQLSDKPDRLDTLRSLQIPVLVVVGEEDVAFLPESREMAAAIPGAELAVIPNAAHCPQFEAPDAWWDAVSGFLAGVENR
jgi:3-oxoadipate enol-lactonase